MSEPRPVEREIGAILARLERLESARVRALDFLPGTAVLAAIVVLGLFAGAAVRWNGHPPRRLEVRMDRLEGRMDGLEGRMDQLEGRMDRLEAGQATIMRQLETITNLLNNRQP